MLCVITQEKKEQAGAEQKLTIISSAHRQRRIGRRVKGGGAGRKVIQEQNRNKESRTFDRPLLKNADSDSPLAGRDCSRPARPVASIPRESAEGERTVYRLIVRDLHLVFDLNQIHVVALVDGEAGLQGGAARL